MDKPTRLFSLDALRGLDMLFLCVVQPLIMAFAWAWGFADETAHPLMAQLNHHWGVFTAYDLIMPLFIFMCGAAVPLALPRRLDAEGRPTAAFWKHVGGRVALLWFLGLVAQGRLLQGWANTISPFNNTLQAIACGYVIAALVLLLRRRWLQLAAPIALAAFYGLALAIYGDYSPDGNLAIRFEEWFVRLILPAGSRALELADPYYTWWFTIPMFGVMTLCGMESTKVLMSARTPWRKAMVLGSFGAALYLGGLALVWLGVPSIKHIYTVSFTAEAMGISVLLLAALYVVTDIWKFRRGWWMVTLYGQTALAAYVLGEVFRAIPAAASQAIFGGFAQRLGKPWEPIVIELGLIAALTFALAVWRAYKTHPQTSHVC